ncbi:hypothetical protein [Ramlibacter humi]|uniref:Uncharacterized protein n=1 Tax=Ramlibacter humi TaxID=2530451 RepID=A0A4Z0BKU1_9BURK|nr:hypothetical protein [Ramlibacter humi]TFY99029.1 hypothetical protein EZ216_15820 [Ramlibacter humi]
MAYFVRIVTERCAFDIRLNDVPVLPPGTPTRDVEVTLPVNHWVVPGRNTLSVVPDLQGQRKAQGACESSVALLSAPAGKPASARAPLIEMRWPAAGPRPKEPFAAARAQVELPESLPAWAWMRSDVIAADRRTRAELVREYQRLWDAASRREVRQVLPAFAERNRELAAAFHTEEAEMARRAAMLEKLSQDRSLALFPLEPEDAELVVFAGGRLAKLTRWDGQPMLAFNYKDGSGSETFDVVFRRSGGRWVIAR